MREVVREESSGSSAILGVIIGAILVVGIAFYFFGGFDKLTGSNSVDVNIKTPAITGTK